MIFFFYAEPYLGKFGPLKFSPNGLSNSKQVWLLTIVACLTYYEYVAHAKKNRFLEIVGKIYCNRLFNSV